MDSTADDEQTPLNELAELTRQLRTQLVRHATLGAWAAPATPTARPAASDMGDIAVPELVDEADIFPSSTTGRRTLAQVREEVGNCQRCKLHSTRKELVFGVGAEDAPLMFVGEAPGEEEDKRGEPFVGRAGELLDKMIEAMGWTRQTVYITNILMSRPPKNRNPEPDEIAACLPFLHAKIAAVAPRIIVALGRPSSNTLLQNDAPISSLRGRFHSPGGRFGGAKIMPTFHPAYLLREPAKKREAWDDLKLVVAELDRLGVTPPNKPRT